MSHSNSSLNCFANCMSRYNHSYILHTPPDKPPSPHLLFGVMAHDTLYKAGKLRDDVRDGVVNVDEYRSIIPSEVLYDDLKQEFNILNWEQYFMPIIKQTAKYENMLVEKMISKYGSAQIEREVKLSISPEELQYKGFKVKQPLVGIIDCLIFCKNAAIIIDYKFSTKKKTQDDFDMNSQLPLYAYLVNHLYGIPVHNIEYGYIDIPKQMFDKPTLLSNGTLSRAKSQNISQEMYEKSVKAIHGDDEYYNCEPGGYYHDCYCALVFNKVAYLSMQYLDESVYKGVIKDLFDAAETIDYFAENKLPYLKKYDAYSCKGCEYLTSCKPWLTVDGGE